MHCAGQRCGQKGVAPLAHMHTASDRPFSLQLLNRSARCAGCAVIAFTSGRFRSPPLMVSRGNGGCVQSFTLCRASHSAGLVPHIAQPASHNSLRSRTNTLLFALARHVIAPLASPATDAHRRRLPPRSLAVAKLLLDHLSAMVLHALTIFCGIVMVPCNLFMWAASVHAASLLRSYQQKQRRKPGAAMLASQRTLMQTPLPLLLRLLYLGASVSGAANDTFWLVVQFLVVDEATRQRDPIFTEPQELLGASWACAVVGHGSTVIYVLIKLATYIFFFIKQRTVRVMQPSMLWTEKAVLAMTSGILLFGVIAGWLVQGDRSPLDGTCLVWAPVYIMAPMTVADTMLCSAYLYLFLQPLRETIRNNRQRMDRRNTLSNSTAVGATATAAAAAWPSTPGGPTAAVMRINTKSGAAYAVAGTTIIEVRAVSLPSVVAPCSLLPSSPSAAWAAPAAAPAPTSAPSAAGSVPVPLPLPPPSSGSATPAASHILAAAAAAATSPAAAPATTTAIPVVVLVDASSLLLERVMRRNTLAACFTISLSFLHLSLFVIALITNEPHLRKLETALGTMDTASLIGGMGFVLSGGGGERGGRGGGKKKRKGADEEEEEEGANADGMEDLPSVGGGSGADHATGRRSTVTDGATTVPASPLVVVVATRDGCSRGGGGDVPRLQPYTSSTQHGSRNQHIPSLQGGGSAVTLASPTSSQPQQITSSNE